MFDYYWGRFHQSLKLGKFMFSLPYEWNEPKKRLVLISDPKFLHYFKALTALVTIHIATMIAWTLLIVLPHESNIIYTILSATASIVYLIGAVLRETHVRSPHEIIRFMNAMIACQKNTTAKPGSTFFGRLK
jgi:hypothetical protein